MMTILLEKVRKSKILKFRILLIFLNDVKDFIFAAEHRDITGDCSAL